MRDDIDAVPALDARDPHPTDDPGPLWWQVIDDHPLLLALLSTALGCIPYFWRT